MQDADTFFSIFICCFYLFFIALSLTGTIFWIYMLIDVTKRDFAKQDDKIIWLVVVSLTGWIGALVYFFTARKQNS